MENFKVLQWVVWLLFALVVWALAVTFVKKKQHIELEGRVSEIELTFTHQRDHGALAKEMSDKHESLAKDVNTLETKVDELPDKSTIHRVESDMRELKGQIDGVEKLLGHISSQVGMLVENEITQHK